MTKSKIFIACDTTKISKINNAIPLIMKIKSETVANLAM